MHAANADSKITARRGLGLGLFAVALVGTAVLWSLSLSPAATAIEEPLTPTGVSSAPPSFADVIETVNPAVVNISVKGRVPGRFTDRALPFGPGFPFGDEGVPGDPFEDFLRRFFERQSSSTDRDGGQPFEGMGSGFIIDPEGYVVTNYHVVDHAEEIVVTLGDGTQLQAVRRGVDPKTDLALLKVESDDPLPYVALGDSDDIRVGDWVIAIGNPFGLGGTATTGIISARGRDIRSGPYDDFLQIDAPINRGNSGGPLFDLNGRVVGVNTAIFSPNGGSVGIGFAIPSSMAAPILEDLRENGTIERGWLGVQIQPVDEAIAEALGLDEPRGALVADVTEESPAAKAGVREGDVILSWGDSEIDEIRELSRAVASTEPAAEVEMEVWRGGRVETLEVVAGAMPAEDLPVPTTGSEAPAERLGLRLDDLSDQARAQLRLPSDLQGAVIVGVDPDSAAAREGLRRGDVITMVGQQPVKNREQAMLEINSALDQGEGSLLLQIARGNTRQFVALSLE
jgi:serine protease Do